MTESVIDFPKDSLCPEIWEKVVDANGMQEIWQLKPEVRAKIQEVFEQIVEATKQHFNIIHITGSITSNSYTENADIDMHFLSDQYEADEAQAEEINKMIRAAYEKTFVGKHPIEVYFQANKFQDMMSVGCYDFFTNKWLVGPELTSKDFNPYKEYYAEVQKKSEALASQIRNMIFSIYEIAIVYKKNIGTDFGSSIRIIFVKKLQEVQQLYDSIRQMRKVYSSPESEEQALKFRSSRKWKIADASFKLFDKYGYTAILKQFVEDSKLVLNSDQVDYEVVEDILNTVKKYINNADKLAEKEIFEDEQIDEGAKEVVSSFALALALLIPGFASAKTAQAAQQTFKADTVEVQKKQNEYVNLLHGQDPNKMMNGYKMWQALNIFALTLYGEGRGEIKAGGLDPITDSILNRTAKTPDVSRAANICVGRKEGKAFQYSFWNNNKNALATIKSGEPVLPAEIKDDILERKAWQECLKRSVEVMSGKYKVQNPDINSYHVTSMTNPPVWSAQMKNVKYVGHHKFGYVASNDPTVMDMATMTPLKKTTKVKPAQVIAKPVVATSTYVVSTGDNLTKIAKKFGTTVDQLAKLNNMKTSDILSVGKKLAVPATTAEYVVKPGDTLNKIAKANGKTVEDLVKLNSLKDQDKLSIGQKLKV